MAGSLVLPFGQDMESCREVEENVYRERVTVAVTMPRRNGTVDRREMTASSLAHILYQQG